MRDVLADLRLLSTHAPNLPIVKSRKFSSIVGLDLQGLAQVSQCHVAMIAGPNDIIATETNRAVTKAARPIIRKNKPKPQVPRREIECHRCPAIAAADMLKNGGVGEQGALQRLNLRTA